MDAGQSSSVILASPKHSSANFNKVFFILIASFNLTENEGKNKREELFQIGKLKNN
jgi:hypothetical protein